MSTDSINSLKTALGAGSGIDIRGLAQNLTDIEREPRSKAIQARIDKSEARISGYGAVMFALSRVKEAFEGLNDLSDFGTQSVRNSAPGALEVTASTSAASGRHTLEVLALARPQITQSAGYANLNDTVATDPFTLTLTVNGVATPIAITPATDGQPIVLADVARALNAANTGASATGVSAQVVDTGDPAGRFALVLGGAVGAGGAFTLASSAPPPVGDPPVDQPPYMSFSTPQTAQDARLKVDGVDLYRPSNTVTDAIAGVTLDLLSTTQAPATVSLSQDTAPARAKIAAMVSAYNDLQEFLDTMTNPKSDDEDYGGVLMGDSLVRLVRDQVRSMVTAISSTPGGADETQVTALRDIGVTLQRDGRMKIDDTRLDAALANRYSELAMMFSAGTNGQTMVGEASRGLAGDALVRLETLMGRDGLVAKTRSAADQELTRAQKDLERLQMRMDLVYERYLKQFTEMDSLVSRMNSLRDSLKGQFENLAAAYRPK